MSLKLLLQTFLGFWVHDPGLLTVGVLQKREFQALSATPFLLFFIRYNRGGSI